MFGDESPPFLDSLQQRSTAILNEAKKLGKPNSPNTLETNYLTCNASTFPCTCVYKYGGYSPSVGDQGHRQYVLEKRTGPGFAHPEATLLLRDIKGKLASRLGLIAGQLPDYVVANQYSVEQRIGEHCDDDLIFRTKDMPATIVSINLNRDGVFLVRPNADERTRQDLGLPKKGSELCRSKNGFDLHVLVRENSILVMGGMFQRKFTHQTIKHSDILRLVDVCPELEHAHTRRLRQDIVEAYRDRKKHPLYDVARQVSAINQYDFRFVVLFHAKFSLL